MFGHSEDEIRTFKERYPSGTRVKCIKMTDPYCPVPTGTFGTVDNVDDAGTIHVSWDNGSSLGLIVGEDEFIVVGKDKQD